MLFNWAMKRASGTIPGRLVSDNEENARYGQKDAPAG